MADKIVEGLVKEGVNAKLFQVSETLPQEVLTKMHAVKLDVPVITPADLANADGFMLGFSTRYGMVIELFLFLGSCTNEGVLGCNWSIVGVKSFGWKILWNVL